MSDSFNIKLEGTVVAHIDKVPSTQVVEELESISVNDIEDLQPEGLQGFTAYDSSDKKNLISNIRISKLFSIITIINACVCLYFSMQLDMPLGIWGGYTMIGLLIIHYILLYTYEDLLYFILTMICSDIRIHKLVPYFDEYDLHKVKQEELCCGKLNKE